MAEVEFNEKYSEIFKLHGMLTEAGIDHDFNVRMLADEPYVYQIYYPNKESFETLIAGETVRTMSCSVVEGWYSCGGDKDQLEIMGLVEEGEALYDSVVGYLSAENVFERIKKADEERQLLFRHMGKNVTIESEEN